MQLKCKLLTQCHGAFYDNVPLPSKAMMVVFDLSDSADNRLVAEQGLEFLMPERPSTVPMDALEV